MDLFRSLTGDVIAKSLDGHLARQKAIVSNISNAETPNYRYRGVNFQGDLRQAIASAKGAGSSFENVASNQTPLAMYGTDPLHFNYKPNDSLQQHLAQNAYDGAEKITGASITPTQNVTFKYRNDGNGVDLEREMVALTKNSSMFQALIAFQSRQNQQIKGVIAEQ
ncbi:MAG: flagellar basal body rod protein FlgB [Vampirovibrionales bacterium]